MLCKYPIYLEQANGLVRCNRCLHCRINARMKKTGRLVLESKFYDPRKILFVTLTYSQPHLPTFWSCSYTGQVFTHNDGTLYPLHLEKFWKRLRKRFPPKSIRYFACGEYGDKNMRPHYHAVIWGIDYNSRHHIYDCWSDPNTFDPYCDPARLDVQIPKSEWDVAQYCCSYILKKMTKDTDERLEYRYPEFFRSSQGIGLSAIDDIVQSYHSPNGS